MKYKDMLPMLFLLLVSLAAEGQLKPFYSASQLKYGYLDLHGRVIVKPSFDLAYDFHEGRAAVNVAGKYGYIDETGQMVVPPVYDYSWRFNGSYAAVRVGKLWGFIDKTGKVVVPIRFEEANNYHGSCCYREMAHVRENGQWKLIAIDK
ncbi:MAG: WG repeat-containing protein [Marinilabiliales bacterium]|nr:WG repeat-containing protein [Marinilabiliales bacterium]